MLTKSLLHIDSHDHELELLAHLHPIFLYKNRRKKIKYMTVLYINICPKYFKKILKTVAYKFAIQVK